jgi:hypothetical protein
MSLFVIIVAAIIVGNYVWERLKKSRQIRTTTPQPQPKLDVVEHKPEFLVGKNIVISLDTDIDNHKSKNHFYVYGHSGDRQASTSSEYEYRLEGADVFVRELHCFNEVMGDMKLWKIRDGVVLETELRERGFDDDDITHLKRDTEWVNLPSTSWDGFKYFVISENVASSDARRFFRQELERLRTGIAAFKKLGVEPDIEPLRKCGITWKEYHSEDKLVNQLKVLLGEKT